MPKKTTRSNSNRQSMAIGILPRSEGNLFTTRLHPRELKPLYGLKPLRPLMDMLLDWSIIVGITALSLYIQSIPLYIIAVIIIGARMHALLVLMHDASHFRFLPNRRLGDLLMNMLVCWPMLVDVRKYRDNHNAHHQNLNTANDPDWVAKLDMKEYRHPQNISDVLRRFILYMIGFQGTKDLIWILGRFRKTPSNGKKNLDRLLYYLLLITLIILTDMWSIVLLYWVIPFMTTLMCFLHFRSISEHHGGLDHQSDFESTRTVITNPLERFMVMPHNIGYHLEHHLYPGVPYYNLPILHRKLMELSEYRENAHITRGFFKGFVTELTSIAKP